MLAKEVKYKNSRQGNERKKKAKVISEKPKQKIKQAIETNKTAIKNKLRCVFLIS
jgi:hypothetical protein